LSKNQVLVTRDYIYKNKGTINRTYIIHDSIFLEYLGIKTTEKPTKENDFTYRLFLVYNNQLTTKLYQKTKTEQFHVKHSYDNRK
jgi:hypothetical protein